MVRAHSLKKAKSDEQCGVGVGVGAGIKLGNAVFVIKSHLDVLNTEFY